MIELSPTESMILISLTCYLAKLVIHVDGSPRKACTLRVNSHHHLGSKILTVRSHMNRSIGLLNSFCLSPQQGLLIYSRGRISTKGMVFPIDLIFISKSNKIIEIKKNAQPGGVFSSKKGHHKVLELAIDHTFNLNVGDQLGF